MSKTAPLIVIEPSIMGKLRVWKSTAGNHQLVRRWTWVHAGSPISLGTIFKDWNIIRVQYYSCDFGNRRLLRGVTIAHRRNEKCNSVVFCSARSAKFNRSAVLTSCVFITFLYDEKNSPPRSHGKILALVM